MLQKNVLKNGQIKPLAACVALACAVSYAVADTNAVANSNGAVANSVQLPEIKVVETVLDANISNQTLNRNTLERKQPSDLKALFANELDVQVNALQNSRAGNDGINIRGLQGNRVAMSIDGVPLPETQENKLFESFGQSFGAGNSLEPSALRAATVKYGGSAQSLSGSVHFATLEPTDLLQAGKNLGGLVATGYDSSDKSIYGTVAGAAQNAQYQGLVLVTGRVGNEKGNRGETGGEGEKRTKPNPIDYKNSYVLLKNIYQANEQHQFKLTFEHQQKQNTTALLTQNGSSIDRTTGTQIAGKADDETRRVRVSLGHRYQNDRGLINGLESQLYYQNALTKNHRLRQSNRAARVENGEHRQQTFGVAANFTTLIEGNLPNVLKYGFSHQYALIKADIQCSSCAQILLFDPVADTKQHKTHLYLEDEISWQSLTLTPHLGLLHYRSTPSTSNYRQAAQAYTAVKGQQRTLFLPKITLAWKADDLFQPYFQYSRGVKTPSAQQLTSSFGNTRQGYAVVGNAFLAPEMANNFSLGVKGKTEAVQYHLAGYYNRYQNFIDWQSQQAPNLTIIRYHNADEARIYGLTAEAKWRWQSFFVSGGAAYAKGHTQQSNKKLPLNTVQPLKLKAGLGYEGEQFGAEVQLTHLKAKAEKDMNGTIYNPMKTVNVVDLSAYWQPLKNLTLSANLNNAFNKRYWHWADIAHFAEQRRSLGTPPTANSLTAENASRYSALGRHFNLGVRYAF